MLTLQLNHLGSWYDLDVPQEVLNQVEIIEQPSPVKRYSTMFEVSDSPKLQAWMRKNAYRQAYVFLTNIPDIKEKQLTPWEDVPY